MKPEDHSKGNIMKMWLIAAILIVAILISLYIMFPAKTNYATQNRSAYFSFNNKNYSFTHVDKNLTEWQRGLMNYTVTNSTFELFVFPDAQIYPFWMKNTYYPLDIIWINNTEVVYIANATPCVSYSPSQGNCTVYNSYTGGHVANYVIEAQAGFVNRTGMHVGSTVSIN